MATPIVPPLPINIPGNIVPPTLVAGTGLSEFQPQPPGIPDPATGMVTPVYPGETPPNADVLTDQYSGIVTRTVAPGLVAVAPGLSNVTVLPPV